MKSGLFLLVLSLALVCLGCNDETCPPESMDAGCIQRFAPIREATPMPRQTPQELGIEPFIGDSVVPKPTDPKDIPLHPILNNEGDGRIHNDHYNSGTYNREGLTGPSLEIVTNQLGSLAGICAMMAMLENGYVIGSCLVANDLSGLRVMLMRGGFGYDFRPGSR